MGPLCTTSEQQAIKEEMGEKSSTLLTPVFVFFFSRMIRSSWSNGPCGHVHTVYNRANDMRCPACSSAFCFLVLTAGWAFGREGHCHGKEQDAQTVLTMVLLAWSMDTMYITW